jgi:outer membrane protein TolC
VLSADENRLANEQTVTNLRMRRRDLQIALIKALGGGFDATDTNLAIDGSGQTHAAASPAPAN